MISIEEFLSQDVPPGGTQEWEEWKKQCVSMGADQYGVHSGVPRVCKEILQASQGTKEYTQLMYAAVIALQLYGYKAYGKQSESGWTFVY